MTTKGEWVAYTGSDEQIADLEKAKNGIIAKNTYGHIWDETYLLWDHAPIGSTNYWIIPDDPLREMKIRQAMTGQPVYIDLRRCIYTYQAHPDDSVLTLVKDGRTVEIGIATCNPKWNIPNAEYSFAPFEE